MSSCLTLTLLPPPPLLTHSVVTVFPSCGQEKERSWHQQELDKALGSLEREKMELEMRLKEQQAETEALQTRREEERAEAESALCQVGGSEDWSCMPNLCSPTFGHFLSTPGHGAAGASRRECTTYFATTEQGDPR